MWFYMDLFAGPTEPHWVFLLTGVAWAGGRGAARVPRAALDEPEGPTEGQGAEGRPDGHGEQGLGSPGRALAGSPRAQ